MHGDVVALAQLGQVGQLAALGEPARVVPQQLADRAHVEGLLAAPWPSGRR